MKHAAWIQGSGRRSRRLAGWVARLVAFALSSVLFVAMGPYGCGDDEDECSFSFGVDSIGECGFLADQLWCSLASFEPNDNCIFEFTVETEAECDSLANEFSCNSADFDQKTGICVIRDCTCEQGFCLLGGCLCDDGDDDDF